MWFESVICSFVISSLGEDGAGRLASCIAVSSGYGPVHLLFLFVLEVDGNL